jgi:phytoene/squalene synthetase
MIKQATSLQEVKALLVTHAENFPVASWLCPPHLRPAIAAIYAFARAADDIADEGEQGPAQRLEALQDFRQELIHGPSLECAHPEIFIPLHQVIQSFNLPVQYLNDLLKAFEQDIQATAQASKPKSIEELLQYCQLSANPVGRLLLHLYGVNDDEALRRSDAICSALHAQAQRGHQVQGLLQAPHVNGAQGQAAHCAPRPATACAAAAPPGWPLPPAEAEEDEGAGSTPEPPPSTPPMSGASAGCHSASAG